MLSEGLLEAIRRGEGVAWDKSGEYLDQLSQNAAELEVGGLLSNLAKDVARLQGSLHSDKIAEEHLVDVGRALMGARFRVQAAEYLARED